MKQKIIISGAGYTGLLTALALLTSGMECIIIEKQSIENLSENDGKSFAISKMTLNLLEKVGVLQEIEEHLLPIKACYCFEDKESAMMKIGNGSLLAGMISSATLKNILLNKLKEFTNFKLHDNYSWSKIKYNPDSQTSEIFSSDDSITSDFTANLIISTEGRNSKMIEYFNLSQKHHDYKQEAILFNVTHEIPHLQIAIEKFFPEGAIAILPMKNLNEKNHSAIVWINKNSYASYVYSLDESEFTALLRNKIDNLLGKIEVVNFTHRKKYPLKLSFLTKYSHNNIMFLGDINHAIHPIAGQGFNLTIADINQLVSSLKKYSIQTELGKITKSFFRRRILGNLTMIGFTHILVKMFENDNKIFKFTRNKIIEGINKLRLSDRLF